MIYLPHFMSWVIVVSIFYVLLTIDGGASTTDRLLGGDPVPFLTDPDWLRPMYMMQESGSPPAGARSSTSRR